MLLGSVALTHKQRSGVIGHAVIRCYPGVSVDILALSFLVLKMLFAFSI